VRFAEVFLRLGCAFVAWMMLYAHFLWLAALYALGCGPDGDEMHRLLLGLVPFTCGFAFLLRVTRPFAEIHSMLRWLGLPLLLLLPFALRSVWQVVQSVNLNSSAICAAGAPTTWQIAWAPAQLITLLLVAIMVVKVWHSVKHDAAGDVNT
jgi:hypothetical protein